MKLTACTLALAAALFASCSSVKYGDPDAVETVNIDFGSTDLQSLAGHMVQSMVASPQLAYLDHSGKSDDKRIIVFAAGINNRTSEHIDTGGIEDSIRTSLLQSGKFRLAASNQGQDALGEQVRFQQGSGRVDPAQARAFGKQIGADMVLYGNLRSIEKGRRRSIETGGVKTEDVFYQFNLELTNIETGEVIWADQKDLRKTKKTGLFGS